MYVVGYFVGYRLALARIRRGASELTEKDLDSLIAYLVVGMLIGARLIYVLVYDFPEYRAHPWQAFAVWTGGLSFHGAILGMAIAMAIFAHRQRLAILRRYRCSSARRHARPLFRPHRELHQRRTLWATEQRTVGDGFPRRPSAASRGIRHSFMKRSRKEFCSPSCCGFSIDERAPAAGTGLAWLPAPFSSGMRYCASFSNSPGSPTRNWDSFSELSAWGSCYPR